MLSNTKLEFLKELKSDNFYPFTKDINDEVYNLILTLKTMDIVDIHNYQVSIKNIKAIDEIINSKSLDYSSSDLKNKQNQTRYPARIIRRILKPKTIVLLIEVLASIITIALGIISIMSINK